MVGNPPFLSGTRISSAFSRSYLDSLKLTYIGTGDRADLVASFFRRTYSLLREDGTLGLVATKTISESDTREAGLAVVRKQLQNVPNKGYGYDLLRCLSGDREISDKLNSLPRSEVLFNYRGRLTDIFTDSALFKLAPELSGSADDPRGISITATHDPRGIRYYPISISADILGGRLIVKFVYSENLHHPSTISKLRDAFSESLQIFGGSHEEQTAGLRRTAAK